MIFTFTLRFPLWRGGNHLHFARQVCSQGGKKRDSTGLCLEYSPPPAVLWMDGRT